MNVDKKLTNEWGRKVRKAETKKARRRQDKDEARG
jgi:hypothetical protein